MLLTHTKRGWRKSRVLPDARQRAAFYARMNSPTAWEAAEGITYPTNALNPYTQIDTNGSDFTPEYDANGNQTLVKTGTGIPSSPQGGYAVTGWYITWDLTKNITEVYGPSGFIRTSYTYTPYGTASADGDVEQAIQWSSEMHDTELALVYYNYRYYNPTDGRWTRRDPIESKIKGLYIFVVNMPISGIDSLGGDTVSNRLTLSTIPLGEIQVGECGAFSVSVMWNPSPKASVKSFIIQHVKFEGKIEKGGETQDLSVIVPETEYTEFWQIGKDSLRNTFDTSDFGLIGCLKGSITIKGEAYYVVNEEIPNEAQVDPNSPAGILRQIPGNQVFHWGQKSAPVNRGYRISWDCSITSNDFKTHV